MKINPLQDYVVLKEVKYQSKSSLVLPEDIDIETTSKGEVLEVGPDVSLLIKKGDIVMMKQHNFEEVIVDSDRVLIGRQENIYAILPV